MDRFYFCNQNLFQLLSFSLFGCLLLAEFFFVDTTPFVDKYFDEPKNHAYHWRGVLPRDKYISNLLRVIFSKQKKKKFFFSL